MNPTTHVQQGHEDGCVHACIAMVSGRKYSDIYQAKPYPLSFEETLLTLAEFGCVGIPQVSPSLPLRPCIVLATVPSLNEVGGNHMVVLQQAENTFEVLDPQAGRAGKKCYVTRGPTQHTLGLHTLQCWTEVIEVLW